MPGHERAFFFKSALLVAADARRSARRSRDRLDDVRRQLGLLRPCDDGVQNRDESDVDCGGTTCPVCQLDRQCVVNTDCATGLCSGNVCVAPTP